MKSRRAARGQPFHCRSAFRVSDLPPKRRGSPRKRSSRSSQPANAAFDNETLDHLLSIGCTMTAKMAASSLKRKSTKNTRELVILRRMFAERSHYPMGLVKAPHSFVSAKGPSRTAMSEPRAPASGPMNTTAKRARCRPGESGTRISRAPGEQGANSPGQGRAVGLRHRLAASVAEDVPRCGIAAP